MLEGRAKVMSQGGIEIARELEWLNTLSALHIMFIVGKKEKYFKWKSELKWHELEMLVWISFRH